MKLTPILHVAAWRQLRAGRELGRADVGQLWRVRRGVVGVSHAPHAGDERPQFLALPGDLIGADALAGDGVPTRVYAVTAAEIESVVCADEPAQRALLSLAYAQSRRQGREILRLRTGPLAERVRHMLLLLRAGESDVEEVDIELPSLRRLADILDASPEAICRVLRRMRQLEVLLERGPRRARVATRALCDMVPMAGMSSSLPIPEPYRLAAP